MPVFDIPPHRLVDLNDEDLRELLARLCEAERERQGGHRNEVRWGGNQTAADGGLDVVVEPLGSFVPVSPLARRYAGIQVKVADLATAAIKDEMRYGGSLRPAISALAARSGSYLIASARANCSESMLKRRVDAMRAAVADDPNEANLELSFLDRNAISRWVSAHPSVAAWLRKRLTLPFLAGWQPFGRWSSTPEGESDDLICEGGLIFRIGRHDLIRNVPEALDAIRTLVRDGNGSVRIAGLSGIGKSRIVQALFEPVGDVTELSTSHAIYTDLGHSPEPTPMIMLEALIERDAPAILVVDNCPPCTHQALARRLAERPGPVRLITVEYDVRTDRPEQTDVIRVEAEGSDIVEALLRRRRGYLSSADAQRLAELAQGNARLGFALAHAAPQTGTLSAFEDSVLFDRLFWQREGRNEELARAAEVLSLVYSFEVDGEEAPDELTFLGSFAELSRGAMHRHAATLFDRGLAQARGRWRAVLPHALANRLAQQGLRSIPWRNIAEGFADKGRLRRSLARRLSYLHDSDEARRIVNHWMQAGGPLNGPAPDMQVLEAVCHLLPDEALQVVDNMIAAVAGESGDFHLVESLTRMISRIAHSEALFPHACASLVKLAISVDEQQTSNTDSALSSLFGLYLSGTLSRTAARTNVARRCLHSNDPKERACGIRMLRSALRTGNWSSSILSYDDARPDAFGWEPRGQEVVEWFSRWLDLAAEIAQHAPSGIGEIARKSLAEEIDAIWRRVPSLRPRIDEIARQLHAAAPWAEGWHSLQRMLHLIKKRGEEFPENDLAEVRRLIEHMAPTDLKTRVSAEIARGWDLGSDNNDYAAAELRRSERLMLLGQGLATATEDLRSTGRDLFECKGRPLYFLGIGLAQGEQPTEKIWEIVRDLHLIDPLQSQQTTILSGFLHQLDKTDPGAASAIRAECRRTPALRREYALFLPKGTLSAEQLRDVIQIATEVGTAAWQLTDIVWREERGLDDEGRVCLLQAFMKRADGPLLVSDALNMLRHAEKGKREIWPEALRAIGLEAAIAIIEDHELNGNLDHEVARVLSSCLRGDKGADANRVMDAIISRAARRYGSTYDLTATLGTLARQSPHVFLSKVFPDGTELPSIRFRDSLQPGALSRLPPEALIDWCNENADRWTRVAPEISSFTRGSEEKERTGGVSEVAAALLKAAPNPEDVVEAYLQHLAPMSWSGSRADIMERRLAAIEALHDHPSPEVGRTIARLAPGIRERIDRTRHAEQKEHRERDQRFE
ncbi:hypothetical protein J7376_17595 [Paracoccus sp. R12_1]|uniref:hypothetical protein n=1 Tax=unclassified Paracoccus (in: a-proteobacteria) TaxID=2688777 RepID=UPI001AD971D1|nr:MULTISPECIES: hypothetical protein [unclassified Paracoccus (in: a-proteobacteria)]MBO9457079.1 hypothetical protein [Paracoccus sp. R12_2]MBO9488332.1 hypothetical protein [Paracoccus sp. R12_1]